MMELKLAKVALAVWAISLAILLLGSLASFVKATWQYLSLPLYGCES